MNWLFFHSRRPRLFSPRRACRSAHSAATTLPPPPRASAARGPDMEGAAGEEGASTPAARGGAEAGAGAGAGGGMLKGRSCKGCLYYSSKLRSRARGPVCVGVTRALPQGSRASAATVSILSSSLPALGFCWFVQPRYPKPPPRLSVLTPQLRTASCHSLTGCVCWVLIRFLHTATLLLGDGEGRHGHFLAIYMVSSCAWKGVIRAFHP